jgi:hypothetical protein
MSHDHHHDNHSNEPKPVAFTAPLILGIVAVFVLLAFVSLGNPCSEDDCDENCSKECKEACAKGDHSLHPNEMKHGEGHESTATEASETHEAAASDNAKAEPSKGEEKKEEAHH